MGAIWSDLGCRAAEFLVADRFIDKVVLASGSRERYERALALGQGLIGTAHLGHWELMASALAHQGFPVTSVAAAQSLAHSVDCSLSIEHLLVLPPSRLTRCARDCSPAQSG